MLTKLQRFSKALAYITQELFPNDQHLYFRCQQLGDRYAKWRTVLQKERSLKNQLRLEKASNEKRPLSQLMSLVRHKPLWNDVRHYLQIAAVQELTQREHRVVVAALIGLILQRNWQRLGVAIQATVQEFADSEKVKQEEPVFVMHVARHKTA